MPLNSSSNRGFPPILRKLLLRLNRRGINNRRDLMGIWLVRDKEGISDGR